MSWRPVGCFRPCARQITCWVLLASRAVRWLSAVVVNEQVGALGRPALARGQWFQRAPALCVCCVGVFCAKITSNVCSMYGLALPVSHSCCVAGRSRWGAGWSPRLIAAPSQLREHICGMNQRTPG